MPAQSVRMDGGAQMDGVLVSRNESRNSKGISCFRNILLIQRK